MSVRAKRTFMCDFETTVYKGQTHTEVWAAAVTELNSGTDDVEIFHSLPEMFDYLVSLKCNMVCYFHNLKFDGNFWLSFLLKDLGYKPALDRELVPGSPPPVWLKDMWMENGTFKCSISALGQWYSITIKVGGHLIDIRDSLKLLPFSVKRIGKSFKTKHKKLDMEYTGYRYAGCEITEDERKYIANDVLVVREALEFMFDQGHNKLTIGSCCLSEFKKTVHDEKEYNSFFPNLYKIQLDIEMYGSPNIGEYIRKSYRGGWCFLVKGKARKIFYNGTTADVNSLYPSMMSSESGNFYPIGTPTFYSVRKPFTEELFKERFAHYYTINKGDYGGWTSGYFFVRLKTRFYLKPGKLPFIQIKNTLRFAGNECLETSDYYDKKSGKYYTHYWYATDKDNKKLHDTRVEMTMTMTDFKLFIEHYDLVDCEILDYCVFRTAIGLFDEYIERYKGLKLVSTGALRELAKLFLNNLYGKMASSMDSSFKIPYLKPDGSIGFTEVNSNDKEPGYIPVGSAITSYARNFTIRAAQKNYHGVDKPGFIYADTDSIHCDLMPDQIEGITVHDKNFCCWKLESCWDVAWFTRQKTYIEHIVIEDGNPVEKPYYNIKCAGMPEKCKTLFEKSLDRYSPTEDDDFTDEELAVINAHYNLNNFDVGLRIPGKLLPKRIPGGVLLVDTTYEMR